MTIKGQSAYFVRILVRVENNVMHPATCLLDTEPQPNLNSQDFVPNDWLSRLFKEVLPSLLSSSKKRLKTKNSTTLHIRVGNLLTAVLFTVV